MGHRRLVRARRHHVAPPPSLKAYVPSAPPAGTSTPIPLSPLPYSLDFSFLPFGYSHLSYLFSCLGFRSLSSLSPHATHGEASLLLLKGRPRIQGGVQCSRPHRWEGGRGRGLAVGKQGVDLSSASKSGGDKRRSPLCQQPVRGHNKSEEGVEGGWGRERRERGACREGREVERMQLTKLCSCCSIGGCGGGRRAQAAVFMKC